ncbi:MAG: type II toxin-antitoxin system HicB family antitoxin [Clostridia bacterium]|nr:type II toxin-antitoxin system HicB family antitoxin [Clostridia bacterium]
MKNVYPAILRTESDGVFVFIPDFNANTQGDTIADAMEQARDAIGIMGIDMEDDNKALPTPSDLHSLTISSDEIISLIDIDFKEYRRKNELRTVKKNCTIPGWLSYEAEKANINFSAVLQNALKKELNLS